MFLKINVLKNSQNLQENTCATLCFNKETLAHVFSCKFCEIFKKIFFYRTSLVAASVHLWCHKFFWLFILCIWRIIILSRCYRTVQSAIWEIFSERLMFCNFRRRLGEWNNSKTWETRIIFANIERGNLR